MASAPPSYPAAVAVDVLPEVAALLAAKDRTPEDVELDKGRHAAELLSFFPIKPGMKVAELGAGGGYTAELLARAVGPKGKVYGQNNKFFLEKFAEKPWSERLKRAQTKNVVRVDREFDDPLPPEAKDLDAVFLLLLYHDTVWLKTDRAKMNKKILESLKPGGIYAIVDHSGRAGTGTTEGETIHRIEEDIVKKEILAAGFVLDAEGQFLRNPADTRDWNASPRVAAEKRGTSDRFVLRFKKPQ